MHGLSLSGIVIYSTDDFGDPSGVSSEPGVPSIQGWMTGKNPNVWILGVYDGLLPDSLSRPGVRPMNDATSIRVNIPLVEGDNYFTLIGQPASTTEGDDFARWSVNLFFDGRFDDPGISVLFPRHAQAGGAPTTRTRTQLIYGFDMSTHRQRVPGVDDTEGYDAYDDGQFRVTVPSGSMLPSTTVYVDGGDWLGERDLKPDLGTYKDWVGSLTITVEASSGQPTNGGGGGGGGFVAGPGNVPVQQPRAGAGQPNYNVPVPNYAGAGAQPSYQDEDAGEVAPVAQAAPTARVLTPTPKDAVDLMKNWLSSGIETPTEIQGTTTPKATPGTPTAAATKASGTPAPTGKTPAPATTTTAAVSRTPAAPTATPTPPSPTATLTPKQAGSPVQTGTPAAAN